MLQVKIGGCGVGRGIGWLAKTRFTHTHAMSFFHFWQHSSAASAPKNKSDGHCSVELIELVKFTAQIDGLKARLIAL